MLLSQNPGAYCNALCSDALLRDEGLENVDIIQCWVMLWLALCLRGAIGPPSLLFILARLLETFDFGHKNVLLLLCALNTLDAMLCTKGLKNAQIIQGWISFLTLLVIAEGPPGLFLLFTLSLEGLYLVDKFALSKIVSDLNAMFCEKGLENICFVACWVSILFWLTIAEGPPGLLLLLAGSLEILDLANEFILNKIAGAALAPLAPALAPALATAHDKVLQEGHEHIVIAFALAFAPCSTFHHGSRKFTSHSKAMA